MKRFLLTLALGTALVAFAAGPVVAEDPRNPNWHIHDGGSGPGHLGIGFFPTILDQTQAEYLADPATCPNATDKALLPSGLVAEMPLRAGVCFTTDKVIHLRTLRPDEQAPGGDWTFLGPTDGGTWVTYYRVTDR
jgi:hypothetical protein